MAVILWLLKYGPREAAREDCVALSLFASSSSSSLISSIYNRVHVRVYKSENRVVQVTYDCFVEFVNTRETVNQVVLLFIELRHFLWKCLREFQSDRNKRAVLCVGI